MTCSTCYGEREVAMLGINPSVMMAPLSQVSKRFARLVAMPMDTLRAEIRRADEYSGRFSRWGGNALSIGMFKLPCPTCATDPDPVTTRGGSPFRSR